jgi:glutaminase
MDGGEAQGGTLSSVDGLAVPASSQPGPIDAYLAGLCAKLSGMSAGEVASYIPALAAANPDWFAIAIATTDGRVYTIGDSDQSFTIQSVSKPFMFGLALEELGREQVLKHVGVEPTGEAFNSTVLDLANNRPFNPMVNAGAIAVSALVKGKTYAARRKRMLQTFERYAGASLSIDEAVFKSEHDTGDRNRMIADLMADRGMIKHDHADILDLYFSQCSVLVTTSMLAQMGATLANGGVHPITGERAIAREHVHDVLTVMNSCGMYNYAGQWSYEVGIPAKSGVSGSILAIIPGQIGIAAFSPRLDSFGNSVRAIAACKAIAQDFGLHVFRTAPMSGAVIRNELRGDILRSKRRRGAQERFVLDQFGRSICVIEAQGALFFGSAERLVRRIKELEGEAEFLILDMRRVFSADSATLGLMLAARDSAEAAGMRMIFVDAEPEQIGSDFWMPIIAKATPGRPVLFADRDEALEWCENILIMGAPTGPAFANLSLRAMDLFKGLSADDFVVLETMARPFAYESGAHILREGEEGRLFFVIAQGVASIRLNVKKGAETRVVRVASAGPGAVIGDMALLDGGPRSADVVADEKVMCYGFSVDELIECSAERPKLLQAILVNLARELAERLRGANAHIRAIES